MTPSEFDYLAGLVKQRSGIVLTTDKGYLVDSRLNPVARQNNLADLSALVAVLRGDPKGKLSNAVIDAMTTNESFFFRDKVPFENFEKVILPSIIETRTKKGSNRRVRIWCAAASSGQEPYSLAMILKENEAKYAGWQFEIVGTDISEQVLEKAKSGVYSQFEVQRGLPIQLLVKYFKQNGEMWNLDPLIKAMVKYQSFNLLTDFRPLGTFDAVFCRNVLIYFDQPTKSNILDRIKTTLPPEGYLVLGAAETVVGLTNSFQPVQGHRGLYEIGTKKPGTPIAGQRPVRAVSQGAR